ncbi:amino acid/amide ABC transporter substrate-binding protein, HAAT family [Limimonas halophila]|uniref:Amino acid/amide ABC transporter substrate-binding protein, HAAT family n=1 Tax=Limimonas halophila TaxID=1082479 RepID=A0A1G7NWB9_9PROT|nr:ABC transporter substrate-binding protein [Limimonas halophila]SDF78253.1 amino acid/amide ABC transporter substrate-binding protein, HAAT family [Limimonas halophila]
MPSTPRLALAGIMAGALVASPAMAQDVKIGGLFPLTGDLQAYGSTSKQGLQLAVEEINAAGGVLGEDLKTAFADTKTTPQAGVDAANKLVSVENVAGIVGAMSSGVSISVARAVTSSKGVPQISNASTSPTITTLEDNGYLFRTVPSDALQGRVLGNLAYDKGYRSVSTLYVNNAYGEGLANTFKKQFEKRGGTVPASLPYEKGKASYRGELSEAKKGGAEALALIGYPQNGTTIIRQGLQQGLFQKFIFTDGMKAPEVPKQIGGTYLDDSLGTVPAAPKGEGAAHFESAFKDAYGELPPKPFIDTAYDAAYLLALAMQKAGSTEGEAVRDALSEVANPPGKEVGPGEWEAALTALKNGEQVNYDGAAGSHDFDENGDVPGIFQQWSFKGTEVTTIQRIKPEL